MLKKISNAWKMRILKSSKLKIQMILKMPLLKFNKYLPNKMQKENSKNVSWKKKESKPRKLLRNWRRNKSA